MLCSLKGTTSLWWPEGLHVEHAEKFDAHSCLLRETKMAYRETASYTLYIPHGWPKCQVQLNDKWPRNIPITCRYTPEKTNTTWRLCCLSISSTYMYTAIYQIHQLFLNFIKSVTAWLSIEAGRATQISADQCDFTIFIILSIITQGCMAPI